MKMLTINRSGSTATAARPGTSDHASSTGSVVAAALTAKGCTELQPSTGRSFVPNGLMITPTNGHRRPEERSP